MRGLKNRSLRFVSAVAEVSNVHTAGHTLNDSQRITGESVRQTHSLCRRPNSLGTSSPSTMVKPVSGSTTSAIARTRASCMPMPRLCRPGARACSAPAPPVAAAIAPTNVMPNCTAARLPSMSPFMLTAAAAPRRPSLASVCNRAIETVANAIS